LEKSTFQIQQNYPAPVGFLAEPDFCRIWKKCRIPARAGAEIRYRPTINQHNGDRHWLLGELLDSDAKSGCTVGVLAVRTFDEALPMTRWSSIVMTMKIFLTTTTLQIQQVKLSYTN